MSDSTDPPTTIADLESQLEDAEARVASLEGERPSGGDPSEIREDADRIDRELRSERATARELRARLEERRAADVEERAREVHADLLERLQGLAGKRPDPEDARAILTSLASIINREKTRIEEAAIAGAALGVLRRAHPEAVPDDADLPAQGDAEEWAELLAEIGREARRLAKVVRKADQRATARAGKITSLLARRPQADVQLRHTYSRAVEGRRLLPDEVQELAGEWVADRLRSWYAALPEKHRRKTVSPPGPPVEEEEAPEGRTSSSPAEAAPSGSGARSG